LTAFPDIDDVMGCFTAPAAVGIATAAFGKKAPKNWHVDWLNSMIWGGTAALIVEHVAHGEVVPWPPFFTAMSNPADTAAMFGEILAVGVPMAIALVFAWVVMVVVYEKVIAPGAARTPAGG
jgi:hypothetical protein